jgi:chemotaxis protein CheC
MDPGRLDMVQLDGLREVANIGAGHGATALSKLTGRGVTLEVPVVNIVRLEEVGDVLGDPAQVVAAVMITVGGELTGRTVHIFDASAAVRLAAILLRRDVSAPPELFDAAECSAIEEVSSMIAGAYLNALSQLLGTSTLMSVPEFTVDMTGAILFTSYVNFGDVDDHVLYMDTRLGVEGSDEPLRSRFLFLPDPASLERILRGLRLA